MAKVVYVFYRGDDVQFVGTVDECVEHFNMTRKQVYWYATPANMRRVNSGVGSRQLYAVRVKEPSKNLKSQGVSSDSI